MAILFVRHLAIYNNEILPNTKNGKVSSNFAKGILQIANLLIFATSAKFDRIWTHFNRCTYHELV